MDNKCSFDCKYCPNTRGCNNQKASYKPEELAGLFNYLHKRLKVAGLFLSSGVAGDPDNVTERAKPFIEVGGKRQVLLSEF